MRADFSITRYELRKHRTVSPTGHNLFLYLELSLSVSYKKLLNAIRDLYTDILNRIRSRTLFSFQKWESEIRYHSSFIEASIWLPFRASHPKVPYTSNIWNNPTFEGAHPKAKMKTHQPLQESFMDLGIKTIPGIGVPIDPVKWPNPPEVSVVVDANDLVKALSKRVK